MSRSTKNDALPLPEVAQVLGLSWHGAWDLVLRGELTGRKVSGRWLIDRASLDRYQAARLNREPAGAA